MRRVAAAALLCVGLAGCHQRPKPNAAAGFGTKAVSLRGTYGVAHAGTVEPVLKVSEVKTGYQFEERTTGEWKPDAQVPHVATEAEVRQVVGATTGAAPVFGLATDSVWLLKVPAGWSGGGVVTKSGYLLVSEGKLAPAEKVELGGR